MKNICVIGVGYVGLTTGTCFADLGNNVCAVDISQERIENLRKGIMPIYEPGLKEMAERNMRAGRLSFTTSYAEGLKDAEFVFICVGTPEGESGEADLRYIHAAAETIAKTMDHSLIVINKSTVPIGTGDVVSQIISSNQPKPIPFSVVSCPEFLREGSAIRDFQNPDRTVLGSVDRDAAHSVAQLYLPVRSTIMVTDLRTAEMIKYASNAFLATRISFINEIANICEALGADVKEVAQGMGYDKRIGHSFLEAGVGYGGSCFLPGETVFVVDDNGVTAQSFESLFAESGEPFAGDQVDVISPTNKRVLAFDLQTGCPAVADVNALTRRPYMGTIVTIKTSMGRTVTVTADHPVILHKGHGFDVVLASEVKPGDQLMTLSELPALPEVPRELNLIALLRGTELATRFYVSSKDDALKQQCASIDTRLLLHKRHDRMSIADYHSLTDAGLLNLSPENLQVSGNKITKVAVNAVIPIDGDLLRLCGYYLAEGCINQDTNGSELTVFTFHEDEHDYINDVQRILEKYGVKFGERYYPKTHARHIVVYSHVLTWIIRDILRCGTRSSNKQLPQLAFNVSPELRYELIRGAFSGDGSLTTVQNGKNMMLEYATVSKRLADAMSLLLQTIGIVPSLRVRMMSKSTQPAYIIRVSGFDQLTQLINVFGSKRHAQMETILKGYQRQIKQRGFSRGPGFTRLTVLSTENEPIERMVYSLETNTGTITISQGMILHNCFPKDVKALAYMAQVSGKHPELLNAVMEINDGQRQQIVKKLDALLDGVEGKVIGLLGLAFKENTDDLRESPAMHIAQILHDQGAVVRGYDPVAMENVMRAAPYIHLAEDAYDLARSCDALVIATPWNEFKNLDMVRVREVMKQPILVDGRNLYDAERMQQIGFVYRGVGRGYNGNHSQVSNNEKNGTQHDK